MKVVRQHVSQVLIMSRRTTTTLAMAVALAIVIPSAQAQTFTVLHNFTGGPDGAGPVAGLTIDASGNLYGTASAGGNGSCSYNGTTGCGTVFKLTHRDLGWTFAPLYSFQGGADGEFPARPMTIGPNGSLYGATVGGGEGACDYYGDTGCGTVFNVTPSPTFPRTPLQPWLERVLYRFTGGTDGGIGIAFTTLLFDHAGNMYGTTCWSICTQNLGGEYGYGAVFELSPSGNSWTESVIYSFAGGTDGANPQDGLISDNAGNLYGTTANGGGSSVCVGGCGTVFELSPSGSGWTEKILYSFEGGNDGWEPYSGLVMDAAGNLYGNTSGGGMYGGGTVYQLAQSGGNWSLTTLTSGSDWDAIGRLAMDSAGNLYEVTSGGGIGNNSLVFELTPSNGHWIYTLLHDFGGGGGSGAVGGAVLDSSGNIYGTASGGGIYGDGTVWEITP